MCRESGSEEALPLTLTLPGRGRERCPDMMGSYHGPGSADVTSFDLHRERAWVLLFGGSDTKPQER